VLAIAAEAADGRDAVRLAVAVGPDVAVLDLYRAPIFPTRRSIRRRRSATDAQRSMVYLSARDPFTQWKTDVSPAWTIPLRSRDPFVKALHGGDRGHGRVLLVPVETADTDRGCRRTLQER
jgi:hypothetical protein